MVNALDWANNELMLLQKESDKMADKMLKTDEEKESAHKMQEIANKDVYALLDVFANQGHTGGSALYVLELFNKLCNWLPLTPLTGEEEEWQPCNTSEDEKEKDDDKDPAEDKLEGLEQNKRCPYVFRKDKDNDTAFNQQHYLFLEPEGKSPFVCRDSRGKVKFPCNIEDLKPMYIKLKHPIKEMPVKEQMEKKEFEVIV